MFFKDANEIQGIASKTGCAVFVVPDNTNVEIKNAIILEPVEKNIITIEQVRDTLHFLNKKQTSEQFVLIRPADLMGEEAANAFLKNLEEPKDHIHFVLITSSPSKLLPTILSRAAIYSLKLHQSIDGDIDADDKIKDIAKRLLVAKSSDLPAIAEEIAKKKDGVREYALKIVGTTIEMLYKSYFKTGKTIFVNKLPKFLTLYNNLEKNGHIKLHLVADLC